AGWRPLVPGYDRAPPMPSDIAGCVLPRLRSLERASVHPETIRNLKADLGSLYQAATLQQEPVEVGISKEIPAADDGVEGGAYLPIRAETFIEEISEKLEIHPISVYWLLEEMRREEGLVCPPEMKRH